MQSDYNFLHLSRLLKSICDSNNFQQLVKEVTRVQYNSVTSRTALSCLDHIYTNAKYRCSDAVVTSFGDSDHDIVSYTRFSKLPPNPTKVIYKRSFKHFDREAYLEDMKCVDWSEVYLQVDVDLAAACLTHKINVVLDIHAPWVRIYQRKNFVPWLSSNTRYLIKERDLYKRIAKNLALISTPDAEEDQIAAWEAYRVLRNKINDRKKQEEFLYKSEKMQEVSSSSSALWKTAKGFMGWKSNGSPKQLIEGNRCVQSPKEIAQVMNLFFINKVRTIRESIPDSVLDLDKVHESMQNKDCYFEVTDIPLSKVKKLVRGLSNSKSTSLDGLNNFVVKLLSNVIASPLHHVISLSIIQNKFPSSWKVSKVIPLHKKSDPMNKENYRPIALLSPLSKILEKIVYEQLYNYFQNNGLFHQNLHGYRKHRSTLTALLQLYDRWVRSASEGKVSGAVLLDLSAAFDLVD